MPINCKEYRCEWCPAVNGQPHPVTGSKVVLTVAHIDHDTTNNRFHNLAALCQRCHLNHDRHQHAFYRKYGRQTKYINGKLFKAMPTFKKIPKDVKAIGAIGCGPYAIFCKGLLKASDVANRLQKAEKRNGIPVVGYVSLKGEKIYYCRYGFVDDPDVYAK